jgi:predicted nucleotidyltransferase
MSERMAFLKENSDAIKAIAARHKGLKIAVFGSVARGEDGRS